MMFIDFNLLARLIKTIQEGTILEYEYVTICNSNLT